MFKFQNVTVNEKMNVVVETVEKYSPARLGDNAELVSGIVNKIKFDRMKSAIPETVEERTSVQAILADIETDEVEGFEVADMPEDSSVQKFIAPYVRYFIGGKVPENIEGLYNEVQSFLKMGIVNDDLNGWTDARREKFNEIKTRIEQTADSYLADYLRIHEDKVYHCTLSNRKTLNLLNRFSPIVTLKKKGYKEQADSVKKFDRALTDLIYCTKEELTADTKKTAKVRAWYEK